MAVWEKEGWGTTNDCLQMVVDNYKTQGNNRQTFSECA